MTESIRCGVIGCGAIARWHINAIEETDGFTLAAVMDACPPASREWGERYGVPAYTDMETLLREGNVDAVCICTPSGTHAELAMQALRAGKHAIVEKPMAITAASLDELLRTARESTAMLCPISQMRSVSDVLKARELIAQGALGRVVMADLSMKYYRAPSYYEEKKWRGTWEMDGGGALMNQGIHGLDMLRFLCGDISAVSARAGTLLHSIGTEDTLVADFALQNGGMGVLTASTSVYPGFSRRLEIGGTEGSLVMEEGRLTYLRTLSGMTVDASGAEVTSGSSDPAKIDYEPHVRQYRDIAAALLHGAPLMLTPEDAAETIRLILSIYQSAYRE